MQSPYRVLIAKPGLDGHDRGAADGRFLVVFA
jgi:methylmalonyl-CoA mutase cobalamin-binding subunit